MGIMVNMKKFGGEKGVLLIEVLLAFLLLSIVVISSGGLLIKTAQMSEDNRGRLLALQAAQSALETIKDTPLTSLATIDTTSFVSAYLKNGAVTIQTNPAIDANTQITTITVTVSWQGAMNRSQQLQVSTMRSRF
jgi:Tfp pilus assembly protein PilV